MYLKKLTRNNPITVDFEKNGTLQTLKGRVYCLNLIEQILSLKDEKENLFTIQLSGIRHIY